MLVFMHVGIPEACTLALALTMAVAIGLTPIAEEDQATYLRATAHDLRNRPDLAFGLWATVALTALAIMSVALGIAPIEDPMMTILAAP
jgi:hypothetical protein